MTYRSPTRKSLAAIRPGERARIRAILFHEVRVACDAVGVRAGDTVTCTESGPSRIVLDTSRGMAALDPATARFVEVDRPATERTLSRRPRPGAAPLGAHPAA